MVGPAPITVGILDDNPIHLATFEGLAADSDFLHIEVGASIKEMASRAGCPDLLLVHLSLVARCPNLLLLQALNTFRDTVVMCYSSGGWVGRRVFKVDGTPLIAMSYGDVLDTLRDYAAFRQAAGASRSRQMTYLDEELEQILTRLSPRERDVLCLLGKGHGNPEIADILGRTANTVESHLKNIRGKLQFKGMTELRTIAISIARTGTCHVFSRYASHICPHRGGESVGCCPLHTNE